MTNQYAYINRAPDAEHQPDNGRPWQFQFGGNWHRLVDESGRPKPYPLEMARVAEQFFTPSSGLGAGEPKVILEIHDGELTFAARDAQKFTDEDGREYGTLAELISAVKERATAAAARARRPVIPRRPALETLAYAELVSLAGAYELEVKSNTSKAQLIEALDASRAE